MMIDSRSTAREWAMSWLFPEPGLFRVSRASTLRKIHRHAVQAGIDGRADVVRELRQLSLLAEMGYL